MEEKYCNALKGRFPFRLGTSSYIIPDAILPNIRYLKDLVDDVEIVLFESDEYSNIPSPREVEELMSMGRDANLSYTIHLPLDTALGSRDENIRTASVGKCKRIIERMSPLEPFGYLLHLHGDRRGISPSDDIERWREQSRKSVEELIRNLRPELFCIETLDYPYSLVDDIPEECGTSICLDIGHILLCGYDLGLYYAKYLEKARVIHLHGIKDGVDHTSIAYLHNDILDDLLSRLSVNAHIDRVLTLEVFSDTDFLSSMRILGKFSGSFAQRATQDKQSNPPA